MSDIIQIQVKFTIEQDGYSYTDALYFPLDQWPVDDATIEAMKQERFANWKYAIENPASPPDSPAE